LNVERAPTREAAKRRKNAAHGASRGCDEEISKEPGRGVRRFAQHLHLDIAARLTLRIDFLSPLRGLIPSRPFSHGLRRGLHSFAASRLIQLPAADVPIYRQFRATAMPADICLAGSFPVAIQMFHQAKFCNRQSVPAGTFCKAGPRRHPLDGRPKACPELAEGGRPHIKPVS
jgi:hypothetical protein